MIPRRTWEEERRGLIRARFLLLSAVPEARRRADAARRAWSPRPPRP